METAVDDDLISRNPCRIKGAGKEVATERQIATVAQVDAPARGAETSRPPGLPTERTHRVVDHIPRDRSRQQPDRDPLRQPRTRTTLTREQPTWRSPPRPKTAAPTH
ncbi:MAG: hypothetical protein QOC92_3241 [Acidimicrobiaceae bacterium]